MGKHFYLDEDGGEGEKDGRRWQAASLMAGKNTSRVG